MIYAGVARNESERDQALKLAATSFPMPDDHQDSAILRKTQLLRKHPGYTHDSPIVVCASDGCIVGSAFLIECSMPFKDRVLRGVFVSSVSVSGAARGQGLSRLLMGAAIESAMVRGIDIAIVIARRAVDGYYTRFGFWGVSHYSKVTFELATMPQKKCHSQSARLIPVTDEDIVVCSALHEKDYRSLIGHCLRTPEMWRYILIKLPLVGMRLDLVSIEGRVEGYVIHDGQGNLHEIATVSAENFFDARLFLETCALGMDRLTLHIHPTHPFLSRLEGADLSLTLRECPYGGHMVRILKPSALMGGYGDCKATSVLSFAETARFLSLTRLTIADSTEDIGLHGSFNISLADQI